jgi:O-antigen ligase
MPSTRSRLVFVLLGLLMFLAPLFRSGKIPSALLALELLSLLILVVLWWDRFAVGNVSRVQLFALLALLVLPLFYLLPIPAFLLESLAGGGDYDAARLFASPVAEPLFKALSLYPRETLSGWLVLLLPVATYLAASSLGTVALRRLLGLLFFIAGFQAVLGLVQFGTGPDSPFYMGMTHTHFGSAVGTYTSRNNYVGLLYMMLAVSMALVIANVGSQRRKAGAQTLRQRLVFLSTMQGHKVFLLGAFSLLVLLAVVFSRSRAGISLTILGVLLVSVSMARRLGAESVHGLTGTIVLVAVGFGISIGLAPVLDRFSAQEPLSDGRWTIFDGTFQGIAEFFPFGSGPATYRETFPAFQDITQATFTINQAHNDYLEWLYTGGAPAGLVILCFLVIYFSRWPRIWQKAKWGEFRYIQVGAGIGMLLMLLHELVDYNLFIPANMVFFAFFAGLFFHDYKELDAPRVSGRHRGRGVDTRGEASSAAPLPTELYPVVDGTPVNPFMDE